MSNVSDTELIDRLNNRLNAGMVNNDAGMVNNDIKRFRRVSSFMKDVSSSEGEHTTSAPINKEYANASPECKHLAIMQDIYDEFGIVGPEGKNEGVKEDIRPITKYDKIHPSHYDAYDIQVIDMMERIFGREETAIFCKLNAFKYRMRMGLKLGEDMIDDLKKEQYYLNKKKELESKSE